VAACLLREQGLDVVGVFMRHGEASAAVCASGDRTSSLLPVVGARADHKQGCCSASDADDARRVADKLDIPFYALDFHEEFGQIIDYFVEEYTAARTPNPCVMCNNWLKFGKLFEYADSVGAEYVATGHYARVAPAGRPGLEAPGVRGQKACGPKFQVPGPESASRTQRHGTWDMGPGTLPALFRGVDASKDQSYVLFGIERKYLTRMLLPVGSYEKSEIRKIAAGIGLRVADKRDSQEICFVTSGDHAEFVRRRRGEFATSGEIVTTDGAVVGRHDGLEGFTIGQRKGLGIAFGEPRYVVRLEAESRRVVIGTKDELARRTFTANRANWLVDPPTEPFACDVQIRYNSAAASAMVTPLANGRFEVLLDEPRGGIAPGQAAVCYDGDRVLGGGWIE
jgi:tRNA-specific 2-thiouridylase